MPYFKIIAAAAVTTTALTVLFCGMYGPFVRSIRTVSCHHHVVGCCVLLS